MVSVSMSIITIYLPPSTVTDGQLHFTERIVDGFEEMLNKHRAKVHNLHKTYLQGFTEILSHSLIHLFRRYLMSNDQA